MLGMGSMFGANSFGLGGSSFLGSIWGSNLSSSFMNCKGIVDYDSMALAGVGNFLTNFLLNTFSGYISSKKENSTDNIKNDINEMDSSIKELKKKHKEHVDEENNINKKINEYDSQINSKETEVTNNETKLTTLNTNLKNAEEELKSLKATELTDENKEKIEKQISEKEKEIDELKKQIETIENDNTKLKGEIAKLEENKKTENEKLKIEQAEINKINIEIEKFENYKKNAQKMLNNEILEKADGYKIQRTNQNDYDKLFTKDDNNKITLASPKNKTTKEDVRFAILGYNKASTNEEKKDYQEQFKLLWENLPIEDRTNSLRAAANIILG
jgi:chromosome segregation ATPase